MKFVMLLYVTLLCLTYFILGVTDGLSLPQVPSHTCVIGAGYSGLAAARYLKEYGINFTVFEAAKDVGGQWRFDPRVGTDEYGVPLATSQYKYLRTNTPRQTMEFNGFPFPEDTPSYPSGSCFSKYVRKFAKDFGLLDDIQLLSYVTSVKRVGSHWDLIYNYSPDNSNYTVHCDNVIIANGQYVQPVVPKFAGLDTFRGTVLHSHDYRDPCHYKGRKVLLLGAGASGLDLSTQLVEVADKLVHSHHLEYNQPNYPENYIKKPDIKGFVANGVVFVDGSFEEVDTVIFATGYNFGQPFLDESSGLTTTGKYVLPLHRNIVNIMHPTMFVIGVVNKVITRLLDAQGQYAASVIAGKFKLPTQDQMLKIFFEHLFTLPTIKNSKTINVNLVVEMDKYFADLSEEAGVTRVPPVMTDIRDFNAINRLEDLLNYRDYDYEVIDDFSYKRWYNPRNETCNIEE
ncbi:senecionine N-oxygenase-like [Epargyreus clarus]|uniref:senecionine N-oxygenase-like n=1 Tax=Epargyreus clarus TaxID=520877 RepID=UPI003C30B03A